MSTEVLNQDAARAAQVRRGRFLEYLTIGWNSLGGLIAITSGIFAGIIALVSFGFDSLIEVSSGAALLWRLHLDSPERRERAEQVALKLVGISFLLLADYVIYDSAKSLIYREPPETNYVGIGITALSLIVMPYLAHAKRRVAANIKSRATQADSR